MGGRDGLEPPDARLRRWTMSRPSTRCSPKDPATVKRLLEAKGTDMVIPATARAPSSGASRLGTELLQYAVYDAPPRRHDLRLKGYSAETAGRGRAGRSQRPQQIKQKTRRGLRQLRRRRAARLPAVHVPGRRHRGQARERGPLPRALPPVRDGASTPSPVRARSTTRR